MAGQLCYVNRIQWKGLHPVWVQNRSNAPVEGLDELTTQEQEQGPSGVHANTSPWGLPATLAMALDLHMGKWVFEPSHLCLRGHEAASGGKGGRDPGSREPYYLQKEWDSKWGRAFPAESSIRYNSGRERRCCRGWEKTEIRCPLQTLRGGILPPPAYPTPFMPCHTETQVQASSPRAIAS